MDKIHCFLERNACLLRSCHKTLEDEDEQAYLKRYSIGESVLENCPRWLVNWAVEILKFVDDE